MKKYYKILTAVACSWLGYSAVSGEIVLKFQESFETDGLLDDPPRYSVENGGDENNISFFARRGVNAFGTRGSGGTVDGDFLWAARDIDGFGVALDELAAFEGRITWPDFNISDVGNLVIEMAVAEGDAQFEADNVLLIQVRFDGGAWQTIGGFRSTGTNSSGRYFLGDENTITNLDDPRLTSTFADFSWELNGGGNTMGLRIFANVNAQAEDYYFDNIRISGDNSVIGLNADVNAATYTEPSLGGTTPATLTLSIGQAAPAGGKVFDLVLDEVADLGTDLPDSVTIPEGQTSVTVNFNVLQDGRFTGDKLSVVPVTAEGYGREQFTFTIQNTTPQPNVVITEICSAPPGILPTDLIGDINGDGLRDGTADEFVELVNFGSEPADISGWTVGDAIGVRHVFPEGTILNPNRAVVVFAGGNPVGIFGGATVQTATQGSLALNNTGDTLTVRAAFGPLIESVTFGAEWAQSPQASRHRGDTIGTEFVRHDLVPESGGSLYSPGTRPSGATFGTFSNTITVSLPVSEAFENGAAITGTITLSSPAATGGLTVELNSDGLRLQGGTLVADEINLPEKEVFIAEGQTTANFQVIPHNDGILDGDRLVRIVASAGDDVLPDLAVLTMKDVEPNPFNFLINELMADLGGTGLDPNMNGTVEEAVADQYIEIVNTSGAEVDVSGWTLYAFQTNNIAGTTLAHVFPAGTILKDGSAVVVLGGGAMIGEEPNTNLVPENFGGAFVQTAMIANGNANVNGVNIPLNGPEITIELENEHGFTISQLLIGSGLTDQGTAVTLDSNGDPVLHIAVSSQFNSNSPGTDPDGVPFVSNEGNFWLYRGSPGMSLGANGGYETSFGWMHEAAYPFYYSAASEAFWYIYMGDGFFYMYDFAIDEWVGTSAGMFPYAYRISSQTWVTYE